MSLMDDFKASCVMLERNHAADGEGGFTPTWEERNSFHAAITLDSSTQVRKAEKEDVSSVYTVTTSREIVLKYHDVFRRIEDGKVFRVTSKGDDKKTPRSAALDMRQVTAEEWRLT